MGERSHFFSRLGAIVTMVASLAWFFWEYSASALSLEPIVVFLGALFAWLALEFRIVRPRPAEVVHPNDERLALRFFEFFDVPMEEFLRGPFAPSIPSRFLDRIFDYDEDMSYSTAVFSDYYVNYNFDTVKASLSRLASKMAREYHEHRPGRAQFMLPEIEISTDYYTRESVKRVQDVEQLAVKFRKACEKFHQRLSRKYPVVLRQHLEQRQQL